MNPSTSSSQSSPDAYNDSQSQYYPMHSLSESPDLCSQLSQYCANPKTANLRCNPMICDLTEYKKHLHQLQHDDIYRTQHNEKHERIVEAVNDIASEYEDFQVNKDRHNMHCMQNTEEITIKWLLFK